MSLRKGIIVNHIPDYNPWSASCLSRNSSCRSTKVAVEPDLLYLGSFDDFEILIVKHVISLYFSFMIMHFSLPYFPVLTQKYSNCMICGIRIWNCCCLGLTAVDCGPLSIPLNGSLSGNLTVYPNKLYFGCDPGFIQSGSPVRSCQSNGTWDGSTTYCEGETTN